MGQNIDDSSWGYVDFEDGIVYQIDLSLLQPITVKELIGRLGEPSVVRLAFSRNLDQCWSGELLYPSINTVIQLDTTDYVTVSEKQLLTGFTLLSADKMEEVMFLSSDVVDIEWEGYKDYCVWP